MLRKVATPFRPVPHVSRFSRHGISQMPTSSNVVTVRPATLRHLAWRKSDNLRYAPGVLASSHKSRNISIDSFLPSLLTSHPCVTCITPACNISAP